MKIKTIIPRPKLGELTFCWVLLGKWMMFGGNEILVKIRLYGTKLTKEPLGSGFGAVAEHLVALPSGKKIILGKSMKNCSAP